MSARGTTFDDDRLNHVRSMIAADIESERYDGAALIVGHANGLALHAVDGFADREKSVPLEAGRVFMSMSIAKQITAAVVLNRVERGDLALTMQVRQIIPEFGCNGKENITLYQLLTHTSGIVNELPPGIGLQELGDPAMMVAAICASTPLSRPGSRVQYTAFAGHSIMAEMVRRVDGGERAFRQIVKEDLLVPLGMNDTALGKPAHLAERLCPVVERDPVITRKNAGFLIELMDENFELPAGGYMTTAEDMHRFVTMLRRGGELDGVRILSPAMIELAAQNHTGDDDNLYHFAEGARGWFPFPSSVGMGFLTRGRGVFPSPFGTLSSPQTFGGMGHGSTVFWVDPERDLSFVFLSTGLLDGLNHVERCQRLSDAIIAALVN